MKLSLCGIAVTGLTLLASVAHGQAAGVEPYEEFGKRLRAAQELTPLTSELFGDHVSLYNGSTEFSVTDIDIPGNGALPVQFGRRLEIEDRRLPTGHLGGMGDWDIEVPYIDGVFTRQDGWTVQSALANPQQSYSRCSLPNTPYTYLAGTKDWAPPVFVWDGNQLHIPGVVSEELLKNAEAKLPSVGDGGSYPWVTKSFYRVSCLGGTANGYPGEAFAVLTPAGVRYTFNWVVVNNTSDLIYQTSGVSAGTYKAAVQRDRIFMFATQVVDRFGNWVKYNYNGNQLTSITASDGREIDITWSGGVVQSATAMSPTYGSRTWSYGYTNGNLSSVTLPDGTAWTYNIVSGSLVTNKVVDNYDGPAKHCQLESDGNTGSFVYAIGSPSGATGTFSFNYGRHKRTMVPKSCVPATDPLTNYPLVYSYFDNFTLTSKQITGAGLGTLTWNYSYPTPLGGYYPASGEYVQTNETYIPPGDCAACTTSKTVIVTGPGDITKYTFGTAYARNEGWLLQTETDALDGTVKRIVTNTYLTEDQVDAQPFPGNAGQQVQAAFKNPMVNRIRPVTVTTVAQDGDTYTHQITAFDAFAHPSQTKRYNSIAGQPSIEERTTYLNDLPHWVLGLTQQVDNLTTGETVGNNTYDLSNVTLTARYQFGLLSKSYTYNPQGQVATVSDGRGNTFSVGNYMRGLPRSIQYPDKTSQSLVVDDFGDIRSVTDQAGNTTTYSYDAMGRVSQISYPSNDEQSWYPTTFVYAVVGGSERGLNGTHWRLTTTKGDSVKVTYLDAMLRPLLTDAYIGSDASSHITTEASYDWKGRKTFAAFPVAGSPNLGATAGSHTTYDVLDRVTQVDETSELGTLTTRTAYLPGAQRQTTDPRNFVTTMAFQVFDEPSDDKVTLVQAPEGVNQSISRDIYGNPTAIRQWGFASGLGGDVTKWLIYDAQHRLCRTIEPESGSEVVHYDAASNIDWRASGLSLADNTSCAQGQVAAGSKIQYTYDEMNRVSQVLPPTGTQSTTFRYDPLGNKNYAASGITEWSANRNKLGLITDETMNVVGNGSNRLLYGHDAYGSVRSITYPDGLSIDYAPDAMGRARQAGSLAANVSYFPDGNMQSFVFGNGTQYLAEENARRLLSNFTYGKSGALNLSHDMVYDANGNITNVNDLATGLRTKSFGYDGLNRLTSAQASNLWGAESYAYDPLNNIRNRTTAGQTYTYNYDTTNLLRSISTSGNVVNTFGYDARGNVNNKNGNDLVFDALNQLSKIPGSGSYAYDAAGRRVLKTSGNGSFSTFYFYNQAGQLLYQYDANVAKATDYIYLGKKLIARNESYGATILGNVDGVPIDSSGNASVSGWACFKGTAQSISVDLYLGGPMGSGTKIGRYTANQTSEAGVVSACGVSSGSYRFSLPLSISVRGQYVGQAIYVYGISPVDGSGLAITKSGSYLVPAAPAAPAAPSTALATVASDVSSIGVTWAASTDATSYTVKQSFNSGDGAQIYRGASTTTSVSNPAVGAYVYQVQACNVTGCSAWTTSNTVNIARSASGIIGNFDTVYVDGSGNANAMGWACSTGLSLSIPVDLYVGGPAGGGGTMIGRYIASVTSEPAVAASCGVSSGNYRFSIPLSDAVRSQYVGQPIYIHGISPVGNANLLIGGSGGFVMPASTGAPPKPNSISVPATSGASVAVSWAASSTATSYQLNQSYNGGGWTSVYTGGGTGTNLNVAASGSYTYRVRACNSSGCSLFIASSAVAVTLPPGSAPALSVPSTSSNGQYTINWSGVGGATSYQLQEQTNYGGWYDVQNNGSTSWNPSAKNNGAYSYQVRACNSGGCSGWSAAGTVNVSLNMPLPANGKSYWHTYSITTTTGNMAIGFDIVGGNTWEVYYMQPGTIHGVMASGPTPPYAVTVQMTWTLVGVPVGFNDAAGSVTNGAASPVSVSSNPYSWYTTNSWNNRSGSHARTYQVRVDFFNGAGANISSSTFQVTADTEGAQS